MAGFLSCLLSSGLGLVYGSVLCIANDQLVRFDICTGEELFVTGDWGVLDTGVVLQRVPLTVL